jgi:fluoride exporter
MCRRRFCGKAWSLAAELRSNHRKPPPVTSLLFQITLVAIGGALGGIGRVWLGERVARRHGERFPWGTLAVNVSGAAAIGVLAALILEPGRGPILDDPLWLALVVGVLGSYTTVSSFSLQTLALLRSGDHARALGNVVASTGLCLAAVSMSFFATNILLRVVA